MRWLILTLSLGATLAALYRGIMPLVFYITNSGSAAIPGLWSVIILLCSSALVGFIGGVLCFNQKRLGAAFLLGAALLAYFGYPSSSILAISFATIAVLSFGILYMMDRASGDSHYSRSRYEDDEEDSKEDEDDEEIEENYEDDDTDEDEDAGGLKRSTIKYKMPPRRSSYTVKPMIKPKQSKACMKCGVNVPRENIYCHSCGAKLDGAAAKQREDENIISEKYENPAVEIAPVIRKISAPEIPRNFADDIPENEDEEVPFVSAKHPKKQNHEADSSYQSFGRYAQSRKRRKSSVLQRVVWGVLITGVVGGLALFVYAGIRRDVSPPPVEVSQPRVTPAPSTAVSRDEVRVDEFAVTLPALTPVQPTRVMTIGSVNFRTDHSSSAKLISRLPTGSIYELLNEWKIDDPKKLPAKDSKLTEKWYQIKSGTSTGWLYSLYAVPIDGRTTSLPTGYTDALLSSFGMTRDEIENTQGKARIQMRGDLLSLEYSWGRISLKDDKVQGIQLNERGVSLLNDLSVGMTVDETMKIIGAPNKFADGVQLHLETPTKGIVIRRDADGRIRNINVGSA